MLASFERTVASIVGYACAAPTGTPNHTARTERDAAGMNIAAILTAGMTMHAREAVQHLTRAVLQASGGELRDDATALCLDWHGGPPRDREAKSGANREGRPQQNSVGLDRQKTGEREGAD